MCWAAAVAGFIVPAFRIGGAGAPPSQDGMLNSCASGPAPRSGPCAAPGEAGVAPPYSPQPNLTRPASERIEAFLFLGTWRRLLTVVTGLLRVGRPVAGADAPGRIIAGPISAPFTGLGFRLRAPFRRVGLALALVILTLPAQAQNGAQAQDGPRERGLTRVVGGVKAQEGAWPSQVKIYAPDPAGRGRMRSHCGGTVIGANWVLTAAHCFVAATAGGGRRLALSAQDVLVVAGTARLPAVITTGDGVHRQGVRARAVIYHPDFQPGTYENDIAVLELEEPAGAPALPVVGEAARDEAFAGLAGTVVGWGLTQEGAGADAELLPADLQEVELPLIPIDTCQAAYADSPLRGNVIGPRNLCAGFAAGGRDACRGDSGGPLMLRAQGGGFVQAGIVSWGEGCGRRERYGVYTRLAAYDGWLRRVTRGQMGPAAVPSTQFRLSAGDPGPALASGGGALLPETDAPAPLALVAPEDIARAAAALPQGDRALVVGIDHYPAPLTLTGSGNDAAAVAGLAVEAMGFRREQVMTLTHEAAMRANILAALDAWLVQGSRPGARVLLYFSGQGFQSRIFPALRGSPSGVALAPVDLELVRDAEGQVRDVANVITASELQRVIARLADRRVTALFDTSQLSRRSLQRPARARPGEAGAIRAVEAVVPLSPALGEVLARAEDEVAVPSSAAIWFAAAPDQWALVDRGAEDAPMGVFTRRWVNAVRAMRLVSGGTGDAQALLESVRAAVGPFCDDAVSLCRLGVSPQLAAGPAARKAPLVAPDHAAGLAARSAPVLDNPAGVALDLAGAGRTLRVSARQGGYLILLGVGLDGRVRQLFPDLATLERGRRPAREVNHMAPGIAVEIALTPAAPGAIAVAVVADRPVQALDLPEPAGDAGDQMGSLVRLYDDVRALAVPDPATGRPAVVTWSFATWSFAARGEAAQLDAARVEPSAAGRAH